MRTTSIIGLLLGLSVFIGLIAWLGLEPLGAALAEAGLQVLWLPVFFLFPMAFAAASWRYLFPRGRPPPFSVTYYTTWIGLAVNWLLPVATVGGEVVRVRLLAKRGFALPVTAASAVADKTLQVATQVVYALLGLGLFALLGAEVSVIHTALFGMAVFIALLIAFYRVQRGGLFGRSTKLLQRITGSTRLAEARDGARLADAELQAMYGRRRRLLAAFCWRLGFRFVWAGEVWLALTFLGYPISLVEAVVLESLIQIIRGAAFLVPAGLGAQEAGAVMLVLALGLPGEVGLALALMRRVRELGLGLPGLLAWQLEEGWRLFSSRVTDDR